MIGIIGAMKIEVETLVSGMERKREETVSGIAYHIGTIGNVPCAVAQCGVGKVAAAVCAQTMILRFSPSALINVGVAGGIGTARIGDIVVADGLVQHDVDTTALGDPKGMISGLNLILIPAARPLVRRIFEQAKRLYGEKARTGVVATGDQFICSAQKLGEIARDFGACACEMEGGSIAQVCRMNGVDFAVIRSISDNADEDAGVDFPAFAKRSAHQTAELIRSVLPDLQGDGKNEAD